MPCGLRVTNVAESVREKAKGTKLSFGPMFGVIKWAAAAAAKPPTAAATAAAVGGGGNNGTGRNRNDTGPALCWDFARMQCSAPPCPRVHALRKETPCPFLAAGGCNPPGGYVQVEALSRGKREGRRRAQIKGPVRKTPV